MKIRLRVPGSVGTACRIYFPLVLPMNAFLIRFCFLEGQNTDYAICTGTYNWGVGTCNLRGDQMIITIDVSQHRPISDRVVANEQPSAKFVSIVDKYIHMIVGTINVDVLVLEIQLEPRPEPVVC